MIKKLDHEVGRSIHQTLVLVHHDDDHHFTGRDNNDGVNSPTGSAPPDKALARMSIDDVRTQNRKRSFDGHDDDSENSPKGTASTSPQATYASVTQAPHPSPPQPTPQPTPPSVPPNKKQKSESHTPTGQDDKNTHPLDPNSRSSEPQVCNVCICVYILYFLQLCGIGKPTCTFFTLTLCMLKNQIIVHV